MMKNTKGVYGVTRNCRKCYFKTYYIYTPIDENKRKQKVRRTREQIVEDEEREEEASYRKHAYLDFTATRGLAR